MLLGLATQKENIYRERETIPDSGDIDIGVFASGNDGYGGNSSWFI